MATGLAATEEDAAEVGASLRAVAPPCRASLRGGGGERDGVERAGGGTRYAPTVNFRKLGTSDLEVSEISLGSWLTYSGGVEREQSEACVKAAFEAGINFFDTANVYGRGAAETLLGEVLAGYERSSYVLATKVYFPMSDTDRGLSAAQIHKQIDASLAAPAHRLCGPLPVPPLRRSGAAGGDDGGAHRSGRGRQGASHRLQRVARTADRRVAGVARSRALGLQPAAVLDDLAGARGRGDPAVRARGDLADRVVAAGAGSAHRQVPAGVAAAVGLARGERRA